MIYLNFSNIEELVFHNPSIQKLLSPNLFPAFEQWRLAKRFPMIKMIGKQAILDVLNQLTEDDVSVLEEHFGENIIVERLDYSIVKNIQIPLCESELCDALCSMEGFNYFGSWRDDKHLYLTFWR